MPDLSISFSALTRNLRHTCALGLTLAVSLATGCQDTVPRTPAMSPPPQVANAAEITVHRFTYPTPIPGDPQQNWADLYLPPGPQRTDSLPLVVLIHGGAWQSQIGASAFDSLAKTLTSRGMAVYNVEYRRVGSGGAWPTTFRDVAAALDHLIEVDSNFPQITTDDELVVGHSAGAQLAVWAATRHRLENDEVGSRPLFRPTRVISLAGPLDMVYAAEHGDDRIVTVLGGSPAQVPDRYASVDPIQNIDPAMPVIALHGTNDKVVSPENSKRYVEAATRQGGSATAKYLAGQDHVSIVSPDSPAYPEVLDIITATSQADLDQLLDE